MIKAEEIEQNYSKHLEIVKQYITGERQKLVLDMIEDLGEEYVLSPASTKTWYHNAYPGGYVDHVNRVVQLAYEQTRLFNKMGGKVDYTDEELVFTSLFHDLGKIGIKGSPNYLPQTDKWRQDKLSEKYTNNPDLDFMLIQDRSLFTLQKYNIRVNFKEYLGIKIHDGMFDDTNKPYYISYNESSKPKTNLPYIIHTADFLASKIEYDKWKTQGNTSQPKVKKESASNGKTVKTSNNLTSLVKNL